MTFIGGHQPRSAEPNKRQAKVLYVIPQRYGSAASADDIRRTLKFWFAPWRELAFLERVGLIQSRWEDGPYPRRRIYWRRA